MNREMLLEKIKEKARQDQEKRRDPRFINTMGFLTAKGFLKANFSVHPLPNLRLRIDDAIWAGENVEPRILEVLPAAVLRLGKHFDLNQEKHPHLALIVDQMRRREEDGDVFCGIPYEKMKIWAEFPLKDKRVKTIGKKKQVKTFRLEPTVVQKLKEMALVRNCTETELLEMLIKGSFENCSIVVK